MIITRFVIAAAAATDKPKYTMVTASVCVCLLVRMVCSHKKRGWEKERDYGNKSMIGRYSGLRWWCEVYGSGNVN